MNKIELLKQERDGLDVKELIEGYARTGWQSIPESDVQRLKFITLLPVAKNHSILTYHLYL